MSKSMRRILLIAVTIVLNPLSVLSSEPSAIQNDSLNLISTSNDLIGAFKKNISYCQSSFVSHVANYVSLTQYQESSYREMVVETEVWRSSEYERIITKLNWEYVFDVSVNNEDIRIECAVPCSNSISYHSKDARPSSGYYDYHTITCFGVSHEIRKMIADSILSIRDHRNEQCPNAWCNFID